MNKEQLYFTIFIIHALAEYYNVAPMDIYNVLNSINAIDNYIVKHYDVLHTQGKEYLIDDITEYTKRRGVKIC